MATLAATLVAWGAVQQVTAEVSPTPVLPLPTAAAVAAADTSGPPARAAAEPSDAATPRRTPSADPAARPTRTQPARTPTPATSERPGDDPRPASPVPQEPAATTEAYRLQGGLVTVRYKGAATSLVGATPNSGYVVEVNDSGPGKVDVRFRSDEHESRLVTRVRDGRPDAQREERAR